jgi:hypothetical protein
MREAEGGVPPLRGVNVCAQGSRSCTVAVMSVYSLHANSQFDRQCHPRKKLQLQESPWPAP